MARGTRTFRRRSSAGRGRHARGPLAEMAFDSLRGQRPHGPGEFDVHGLLGERTQTPDEPGSLLGLLLRRRVTEIPVEDVLGGELQEPLRDVFDLAAQLPQMPRDSRQGYACRVQLGGDGQLLGAGDEEFVGGGPTPLPLPPAPRLPCLPLPPLRSRPRSWDGLQDAEFDRVGDGLVVGNPAERLDQLCPADAGGALVGPRPIDLADQAEDSAEARAGVPGLQQLLDAGERVSAVQQLGDLPQPGQMLGAVHVGPSAAFRLRQQAAVLVRPDRAHRGAAVACEVLDAVARSGGVCHPSCSLRDGRPADRAGRRPCGGRLRQVLDGGAQ